MQQNKITFEQAYAKFGLEALDALVDEVDTYEGIVLYDMGEYLAADATVDGHHGPGTYTPGVGWDWL